LIIDLISEEKSMLSHPMHDVLKTFSPISHRKLHRLTMPYIIDPSLVFESKAGQCTKLRKFTPEWNASLYTSKCRSQINKSFMTLGPSPQALFIEDIMFLGTSPWSLQNYGRQWTSGFNPGNPYWGERPITVDLLVLTSLDQLLFELQFS